MMYFIPWVLLLAFVILSVPIASWLDGRKMRAEFAAMDDEDDEELGNFDDAEEEVAEEDAAEGEPAPAEGGGEEEFGGDAGFGGDDFGGDDFAEFEEVK